MLFTASGYLFHNPTVDLVSLESGREEERNISGERKVKLMFRERRGLMMCWSCILQKGEGEEKKEKRCVCGPEFRTEKRQFERSHSFSFGIARKG